MQKSTIDVVIPAYNAQDFIVQAIDSVKLQTYPARTIVVDDGSTDLTAQIVKNSFGTDPLVSYIHKENGGLSSARNRGIAESAADFIAFLDADDVWLPNKLGEQIEVFRNSTDSKLGVVYCGFEDIDRFGRSISNYSQFHLDTSVRGNVFSRLLCGNYVSGSGSGVLVKRGCFEVAGAFDESLPSCEDWDMWLRLARYYDFDYVERPLVQIRRHVMNMHRDAHRMVTGYMMFFNKWVNEASTRPNVLSTWSGEYAVPMIAAVVRELPKTELYRLLAAGMSPQVRHLASKQIPRIAFALMAALVRKSLHK